VAVVQVLRYSSALFATAAAEPFQYGYLSVGKQLKNGRNPASKRSTPQMKILTVSCRPDFYSKRFPSTSTSKGFYYRDGSRDFKIDFK
jgi:hypothetical protein